MEAASYTTKRNSNAQCEYASHPSDNGSGIAHEKIKKGHVIALQGSLIGVEDSDGWRWRSSLSRGDTGGHSCELIWVEDFKILQPINFFIHYRK